MSSFSFFYPIHNLTPVIARLGNDNLCLSESNGKLGVLGGVTAHNPKG